MPDMSQLPLEPDYNRAIPGERLAPSEAPSPDELTDLEAAEYVENDDGSVSVVPPAAKELPDTKFHDNLIPMLRETDFDISGLAADLQEYIDFDKKAREERDKLYAEGLKRTGLSGEVVGGSADFDGASKVVHPMLAQASVDFQSRVIKELFPAAGPVKTNIVDSLEFDKLDRAERKRKFLNWQLTSQSGKQAITEYRPELERLTAQLPMGGSQYTKLYHDGQRIRAETIYVDRMLLPFDTADFYSASRQTHWQQLSRTTFERRVASGLYAEPRVKIDPSNIEEQSRAQVVSDKIEGRDDDQSYNIDGLRDVYETQLELEIAQDKASGGARVPYVVVYDEATRDVISIRRNWLEGDEDHAKLDWFVDWTFIPWRGAYGLGLYQLIGSLSIAGTGAINALLDAALANTIPCGVRMKTNTPGQTVAPAFGEFVEVEFPPNVDDIRKVAMPLPFNQPSPVLFQLLEWLTQQAQQVVSTAEERIADASSTMPVGTALALIEQGSQIFSAIHNRCHHSQAKALSIICRLNSQYLDEKNIAEELGDLKITRQDFLTSHDIQPVSDPNIFSEGQRYAQNQALLQLSSDARVKYNINEIHRRLLKTLKIDNIDAVLPAIPQPKLLDPVSENVAVTQGMPIAAFPQQSHMAHMVTHLSFAVSPLFGGGLLLGPAVVGPLLEHVKQHLTFYYLEAMKTSTQAMMALGQPESEETAAAAALSMLQEVQQELAPIMQMIQQAQMLAQQFAPQAPADPKAQALLQASLAETKRKETRDKAELEQAQQEQRVAEQLEALRVSIESGKNTQDNITHMLTELLKNHDDNKTQLAIAQRQSVMDAQGQALDREHSHHLEDASQEHQMQLDLLNFEAEANQPAAGLETSDTGIDPETIGQLLGYLKQQDAKIQQLSDTVTQLNKPRNYEFVLGQDGLPSGLRTVE